MTHNDFTPCLCVRCQLWSHGIVCENKTEPDNDVSMVLCMCGPVHSRIMGTDLYAVLNLNAYYEL